MKAHHVRRCYSSPARGFVALACLLGLVGSARAFSGNINPTSVPGWVPGPGGGTVMPSAEVKWANSVAKTAAIVEAAGRSIAVEVAFTRTAAAGRVVAAACLANPLVCAGVGMAAWYAASRIMQDPEADNAYVVEFDEYGYIYKSGWGALAGQTFDSRQVACTTSAASYCSAVPNCGVGQAAVIRQPAPNPPGTANCDFRCNRLDTFNNCGTLGSQVSVSITSVEGVTQDTRPATASDMEAHADANPMPDRAANESPVPVPVVQPDITSEPTPVGDTYPGDDTPNEGPWKQDTERVDPIPESPDPTDVEITPETKDADNPNTDEDETPPVDAPPTPEEPVNQCDLNPDTVGCALVGTAPTDEVPTDTADVSWSAEAIGLPVGCPAPIALGSHGNFDFASACGIATTIRPFVVALGALIASLMVVAAVRRG